VAVAVLLTAACAPQGVGTTIPGTIPATIPGGLGFTVVEVLDGDSIRVHLGAVVEEVRILGVNAPEAGECWADEARDALAGMANGAVTVVGDARDQFGRLLAYLYDGAEILNLRLVEAGAAIATSAEHRLAAEFLAAEEVAFGSGIGMWAPNACGPAAPAGITIDELVFDAPGADQENPNGEYVAIGNAGAPIDLTGWVLRDESSVHRFGFPDGFVLGTGEAVIVRSGCGEASPGTLFWCADGSVWNNDGDQALLLDRYGNIVARLRY